MPITDPNRIFDVFSALVAGVDGGRLAHLLEKERVAEGENAVFREGLPINRPPFLDVDLTFTSPNMTYNDDGSFSTDDGVVGQSRTAFQDGILQEASYYAPAPGQEFIMVTAGGRYYRFQPKPGPFADVREFALERRNRSTIPINYHLQAGFFHIVQDGENSPIIFDGSMARRAGEDEIFTGLMMGYGQGRIVLIGLRGDIFFGNLRDGENGGDADVLKFTETQFLNEGGPSALPTGMGFPTCVQFLPAQDTATGVGECLVFGQRGVESFFLSLPRELWKESQFQRSALLFNGTAGHRSVVVLNQDLWFRDPPAGWRSYRQARAQANEWTQVPYSTEVRKWIDSERRGQLSYGSAISFNGRLIVTVNPYPNGGRLYHNGLLSLDFDVLSSFGRSTNPAWDGHWSNREADPMIGLKVTRLISGIFAGEERAFMFYIDEFGHNALREIMPFPIGKDTGGAIKSRIITRSMDCGNPFEEKKLYGGDAWITEVSEPTTFDFAYRPDKLPDWTHWYSATENPVGTPNAQDPGFVPTIEEGFSPRRSLPKPADDGDPITKRMKRRGYRHQFKIEWTGRARIDQFRMHTQEELENSKATIPATP